MRRIFGVLATLVWLSLPQQVLALAQPCGSPGADATATVGVLSFEEGKVRVDFGTENDIQKVRATFKVEGCRLLDESELDLDYFAADGGKDLPESVLPPHPTFEANGETLSVEVPLNPSKLRAGTYSTRWDVSGPPITSTSFKTLVTRSHADKTRPLLAVGIGGVIGFAFAIIGAWAAARGGASQSLTKPVNLIAVIAGFGLAIAAVAQVYFSQYENVDVWLPTWENSWKLAVAAGAAAAGGTVTGQLAKVFRPAGNDVNPT
jgi:hypothetical protein